MKETENKVIKFFKTNATYIVLALCVLAIGFSVLLMMLKQNENISSSVEIPAVVETPDDGNKEDVPTVITFIMPVENYTSIGAYSETAVYSSTLSHYTAHLATDFYAAEGTKVMAVFGGVVESVENSVLTGYTVVIDHGNGLKTVYNSLSEDVAVATGKTVKQGDIIGEVSTTNRKEYKEGAHLHFEVLEDGKSIDPIKYLDFDNK